ncbi:hypothetical protein SK128_019203 [Halocaridina rubra]|uniref:Uncharacterized protein n=1 Tax=Halocaridina rubra TaxID=373956 RepID=A0AAN8X309_HALRR
MRNASIVTARDMPASNAKHIAIPTQYTLDFAQTGLKSGQSSETNCVPSPSMMEVDGIENCENDTNAPPVEEISCKSDIKEDLQKSLEIKEESVEAKEMILMLPQ